MLALVLLLFADGAAGLVVRDRGRSHHIAWHPTRWPRPPWPPTWSMSRSTIIMPCSKSATPFNVSLCAAYGICDYDWSEQKPRWSSAKPMNCSETLVEQARATKAINKSVPAPAPLTPLPARRAVRSLSQPASRHPLTLR